MLGKPIFLLGYYITVTGFILIKWMYYKYYWIYLNIKIKQNSIYTHIEMLMTDWPPSLIFESKIKLVPQKSGRRLWRSYPIFYEIIIDLYIVMFI